MQTYYNFLATNTTLFKQWPSWKVVGCSLKIVLIRHGESIANKERIIQGHKDYPLTERGEKQAKELAEKMVKENFTCSAIYSSDLTRAKKTAEIIAEVLDCKKIIYDERLREMNLGNRQGKKNEALTEEENKLTERIWEEHDLKFPGGGESVNEMKARVKAAFEEIIQNHTEKETAVIVGHGGSLYHILHHILDVFPETDEWFSNCSYNELVREQNDDKWQLTMFNGKKNY
ncbi:MAG: hypothetical protein GF308_07475 [Candidatus Heimdallarchaeota archaeon]|nr:hypothetical protein [Candidatus Heimdallarchaeota archaeon]